ncbi:NUDIX hydrolase [Aestuariispira insulae]|uniref:dATP pyrophosphohydrolase n=1 Tax=Aestuariispira insulae TaxID=1461337 RepID=A0A3D9H9K1_9PROT|nr:NUDIX domain-containing protein [Aestuariispira insulae]RED46155.1 dATP pyrophosphohydrolase [Aestuariispira insulae]
MSNGTNVACDAVAVIVLRADRKVLLLKRSAGFLKGAWAQVTGRPDGDETLWQAALRELHEETALVPECLYTADYCDHFYNPAEDRVEIVPLFVANVPVEAEISLNREHTDYRWVTFDEADDLLPFNGHRQAVKKLHEDLKHGELPSWRRIWSGN